MKIVIDTLSVKSTHHGVGTYIINIINHLKEIDQKNDYSILVSRKNKKYFTLPDRPNFKTIQITFWNPLRPVWEVGYLPLIIKREKADIFWIPRHMIWPFKICKQIFTIHDLTSFIPDLVKTYPSTILYYHQKAVLWAIKHGEKLIAVSHSTKQDLMKLFSVAENKIEVIHNGVDDIFQPIHSSKLLSQVKDKYRLPEKFIFTVSVLEPKKNTENLIRAYAELIKNKKMSEDLQNYKLVIGGSIKYGWKNNRIFHLVKTMNLENNIIFTDFIEHEDLPVVYSLATVFAFPSLYEGFGLPVAEAMACGTPVITSNISSLPEVAGDGAILVNPYDVSSIAQGIHEVLTDSTKRMTMLKKGLENAKRFSWRKAAEEILQIFDEVYHKNSK